MSAELSPSTGKAYGEKAVCDTLEAARCSFYERKRRKGSHGRKIKKRGRFAALEPVSRGVIAGFVSLERGVVRGLFLRMDHGIQYLSDHFQDRIKPGAAPQLRIPRAAPDQRGAVVLRPPRRMLGALEGGICLLTRLEGVLFFPLMVLIIILYWKDSRLALWEIPVILALFAVPVCMFVLRNLIATGRITSYLKEYSSEKKNLT